VIESEVGQGTTVSVTLPRASTPGVPHASLTSSGYSELR
jgi:hypothetical protein